MMLDQSALMVHTVGRERELAALDTLVDRLGSGGGGAIALVGEAGIGKSHLLRSAIAKAEELGVAVATGRATDVGNVDAYRPLLEVASRSVVDPSDDSPYADLVRRVVGAGRDASPAISATALGEAVLRVCAGRLVVLEDLHWADSDTIAAVGYVIDHAADAGLALVATMRPDEGTPMAMVRRAAARRSLLLLEIEPLNQAETGRLAAVVGGSSAAQAAAAIHQWSGGVPLIVSAVASDPDSLRALVNGSPTAPATFADVVVGKLGRLSDDEQHILAAASLLGDRIDPDRVALVAEVDRRTVIAALRSAVRCQLVSADGERFQHSLTRVVVLDRLLVFERQELAARALRTLTDVDPVLRARLAGELGDDEGAATLFLEAGVEAARRGALASAEELIRRSLAAVDSDAARAELVGVLAAAGKASEVISATQNLSSVDGAHRVPMALARARALHLAGRADDAERLLAKLSPDDQRSAVSVTLLAASLRVEAGDHEGAQQLLAIVIEDETVEPLHRSEAFCLVGRIHRSELRLEAAREAFETAVEHAAGSSSHLAKAKFEVGTLDFVEIGPTAALDQARNDAVAAGALELAAHVDHLRLAQRCERMDIAPDFRGRGEDYMARVRRLGLRSLERAVVGSLTLAAALSVDVRSTEYWFAETEAGGLRDQWTGLAHSSVGMLHLLSENRAAALDSLRNAERIYPPDALLFPWRRFGTITALLEGESAVVDLPRGRPIDDAIDLAIEAIQLGAAGAGGPAAACAERAFEGVAAAPRVRAFLQRLVAEAAVRNGFGSPERWLTEAIPVLDASPFEAVAEAARAMAGRSGTAVERRIPAELVDRGVTQREFEVLELLVDGLSYAEIGARIHMSPRTVEGHVGRIRAKFDGISRVELIVKVADLVGRRQAP